MATISRLYDTYEAAAEAMRNLIEAGIPHSDISLVSNNSDNWYSTNSDRGTVRATGTLDRDRDGRDDRVEGAEAGAGIGAVAGGIIGLLTGLGLMAIPGVGPVVAAGWLASTAAGVAAGGATGGIIGALTQAGTSEDDANAYAEGVRRGGTLVSARVPDTDQALCEAILDRASVNIRNRRAVWRNEGWQRFDPSATPYTANQVRSARETYRNERNGLSR